MHISDAIRYIGVMDHEIDLFEGQYTVSQGVSYNSYLILDEKITVMDTVDAVKTQEWLALLENELKGRAPDYLVISHLEPDHSGSMHAFCDKYPNTTLVMSDRAKAMLPQFFTKLTAAVQTVKEGETLSLGQHTLHFVLAPMVHWPEVMVSYEDSEQVLFSADGFGSFGPADGSQPWLSEARRYFINIVGKYGAQVQALLKEAATLDIKKICPLHGPVLRDDLAYYLDKYHAWTTYTPEEKGVVVAYASFHGNTAGAAKRAAEMLKNAGEKNVVVYDLARDDMAAALADAFRYDRLLLASTTYDGNFHLKMEDFLLHLKAKNYQKRKVALIENGSWAPQAVKRMRAHLETMTDVQICETSVSIKTTMKPENEAVMEKMIEELMAE